MAKVYLLTGLSGAGKTTLAQGIADKLRSTMPVLILDGDDIRSSLNKELGFSEADRIENLRRCGEIAKIATRQNVIVLMALIAPYEKGRRLLRNILGDDLKIIFIDCPLEECQRRDPKGNYTKCSTGKLKNYTGVDDRYERPTGTSFIVNTDKLTINESIEACLSLIKKHGNQ